MASLQSVTTIVGERGRHQKTTATAPSGAQSGFRKAVGMSASALEDYLGLPKGAWKRRRLFVLRTMTDAHADAGIPKGAQIVVEPGARTAPGRLVLIKAGDALTVRRVDYDRNGRTVMRPAAPGMLPFPSKDSRQQIVGTIIGVLPRARVADRTVASGRRPPNGSSPSEARRRSKTITQADHDKATTILLRNMDIWARAYRHVAASPDRGATSRWRALAARLQVLSSCLEVAHQKKLYGALAEEANRIISAMRREFDRLDPPGRKHLELLPQATPGTDKGSPTPAERHDSQSDAAKRRCTEPPTTPLDTGLAAML